MRQDRGFGQSHHGDIMDVGGILVVFHLSNGNQPYDKMALLICLTLFKVAEIEGFKDFSGFAQTQHLMVSSIFLFFLHLKPLKSMLCS